VNGEHGSAKSTLCRLVRTLIDPSVAPLCELTGSTRDLMIAGANSHLMCFDNLSSIPLTMSNALARLSTGAGYRVRRLYTDDGELLINVRRPAVVNGINDIVKRPDLLDRSILVTLPAIPDAARKTDAEIEAAFELARPRLLGALLDALSTA